MLVHPGRPFSGVVVFTTLLMSAAPPPGARAQSAGLNSITIEEMKLPTRFLSSPLFRGRNVPSPELEIAAEYLALRAGEIGLEPVLPDGSFFQEIPLEVSRVASATSALTVTAGASSQRFFHPGSFGVRGRFIAGGAGVGEIVFLGLGARAPEAGWDDFEGMDLGGKIVVVLDGQLPGDHPLNQPALRRGLARRTTQLARERGATGVLTVIPPAREAALALGRLSFDDVERGWPQGTEVGLGGAAAPALFAIDLRHDAGAAILGVSRKELDAMFGELAQGRRVAPREIPGRRLEVTVDLSVRSDLTRNVIGVVRGSDPALRDEYVVIGGHHDGIGYQEGMVRPGADDNVSGAVAMLELAEAMLLEGPRRSVIFAWFTGEEKGLYGAYFFATHSPVPLEKISAMVNLDMLSRNDPGSIYVIGSNKLSSQLDGALNQLAGHPEVGLRLDYTFEDPRHPDRFFVRSDQYPFIRHGIPAVWLFSGTTPDYHQATDTEERMDYGKMLKVTRLAFLTAWEVANRPSLLELDLDPRVTTRGNHNTTVDWMQPAPPRGSTPAPVGR